MNWYSCSIKQSTFLLKTLRQRDTYFSFQTERHFLFCLRQGLETLSNWLTQRASKRDHLRDMKIANFQNLFRGSWGCWENPLWPKNFSPGRTGRPIRPILSAIFGYFSNFERQKNPIKCSVLTTFLHLGGQLGQLGSHKSKIGLRTAMQLE